MQKWVLGRAVDREGQIRPSWRLQCLQGFLGGLVTNEKISS